MRTVLGVTLLLVLGVVVAGCGDRGARGQASAGHAARSSAVHGHPVARAAVPGGGERLLLTRQRHPRGGLQYHLYAVTGSGDVELTDAEHNPVVPFIATDTRPTTRVSVDCTDGGFEVTEAEPTKPSGVMFGWDVYRTSYRLDAGQAVPLRHQKLRSSLPDKSLVREFPVLDRGRMLASCAKP